MSEYNAKRDPLKRLKRDEQTGEYILPEYDLPDDIVERAVRLYTLCDAFDWHFPPDVIERQDGALMAAMLEVGSANSLVKAMLEEENKPARKPEKHG